MTYRLSLWPVTLALLTLAGCNASPTPVDNSSSVAPSDEKGTVGVSVLTLTNPFFKVIGDSITAELTKAGYDTVVVSGEKDIAKQQAQVKDFINSKVAAIVLCPCDKFAVGAVIQEANAAGIPVFTCDLACLAPDAKVVSHIATDNLGGGRLAGEAMIEALGDAGGKVVILDFKAAESCLLRVQGFKEVLDKHNAAAAAGGKIEIVAELPGEGDEINGYKTAADSLEANPDLAGIFAINDPSALGARAAVEKAGKADQVKIIGFDGQDIGKQAIKEGKIYADPIQYPDQIGIKTAQSILKYFEGESVEKEQLIPTSLYRQEDGQKDPALK